MTFVTLLKLTIATAVVGSLATVAPALAQKEERPANLAALGPAPEPADNKSTPAKVELGKMLFFDPRLSGNGAMPCSACHIPDAGWDVPEKISLGYPGATHWRNSQTIINSAYYGKLFWAGASKSLEGQARSAARGGVAGNGEDDMMEARLAFVPEYRKRFREVFGDRWPRIRNAYMAIAAFERTLVQTDTPFDKYMRGNDDALNATQKRGLKLFTGKANCATCHNGALLTNEKYYNTGVPAYDGWKDDGLAQITFRFELYAKGVTQAKYRKWKDDPGLYFRTKQDADLGKFRVPSLRYTKHTAPYMHNGMISTLKDAIDFYDRGGGTNDWKRTKTKLLKPLKLTAKEKGDLLAFLESLSGPKIVVEEPDLPEYAPLPAQPGQ